MSGDKLTFKVKTPNGIYTIKKPTGRWGALHYAIMTKTAPSDSEKLSEADIERMSKAFEEWSIKVLPHLIVDGPHTYDDMPGEDQFAIFNAVLLVTSPSGSDELFQIVE